MARKRIVYLKTGAYAFLIFWLFFSLLPFGTMLLTALKPTDAFIRIPPDYFSFRLTLKNFITVLSNPNWLKYYADTIFIATMASFISIFIGSLAAYAFARHHFRMKTVLMIFILALQMIPASSIIIPLYSMFASLSMLDSYLVIILVNAAGAMPLVIWLMQGYFLTIQKELEEAAYIDGCSKLKAFWKITFPLAAPGLAASIIYSFVRVFNDYVIARTLAGGKIVTYTIGLSLFSNQYEGIDISLVSAASFTALVPVIVLFCVFHKYFIIGMTGGAVKG
jgi:multiple sugar transport system permease protein